MPANPGRLDSDTNLTDIYIEVCFHRSSHEQPPFPLQEVGKLARKVINVPMSAGDESSYVQEETNQSFLF